MSDEIRLDCDQVDELDAAFAVDATPADERRAIVDHLESCTRPHERVRSVLGAGVALASSLEPVAPSPELRERLMRSAAATPQDHRAAMAPPRALDAPARRGWLDWINPGLSRGLAAAGVAVIAVLTIWNVSLQGQVSESDRIQTALAEARAIYAVTGEAGQGLLLDTPDGAQFLTSRLEEPPSGSLYVLWLIGADGVPVDVGVVTGDDVTLVPVEDELADYATFAVTVEESRVDAPTTEPVLVASIGGDG